MHVLVCLIELLSESSRTDVNRKGKASIISQKTTKNNNNIFDPSCTNFAYLVSMLKLLQSPVLPNSECKKYYMCNGRLPARCKWGTSPVWDVTYRRFVNQSTLRNSSEERQTQKECFFYCNVCSYFV